ncbi:hypothetical protein BCBMB205_26670 [Bacillus sp. CN2]|nr:hypothetical protein BCBMB205_26670 [Bacillus velezensis]ARZ59012.1 hypothetical protein BAGQ_2782 [Bacillus velezensis]GFR55709.1 hypothetical protein BCBMB205_26670 [Bacillus sp. CN2]
MRSVSIFLLFLRKCKTDGEKGKTGFSPHAHQPGRQRK